MAGDSSFDVVSKVDRQEVDNALNQAAKEISQRYDFKGTDASIAWSGYGSRKGPNSLPKNPAVWKARSSSFSPTPSSRCPSRTGPPAVRSGSARPPASPLFRRGRCPRTPGETHRFRPPGAGDGK